MSTASLERFSVELIAEFIVQNIGDEESTMMFVLYDPASERERYNAYFDFDRDHFVICEARNWHLDDDDISEFGYATASDLEEISTCQSAKETAGLLVELVVEEGLLPAVVYAVSAEEEDD